MINVEEHLGLVHYKAKTFYKSCEELCEYDDLIGAGYLGLCKAALTFDESRGFKFSTLAGKVIAGEMKRLILDNKHNFKRTSKGYERVYVNSLNVKIGDSENSKEQIELIVDYSDTYSDVDMQLTFEMFNDEERQILDLYFNKNFTQMQIAEVFNFSQVQISRKIKRCLNVLKEAI